MYIHKNAVVVFQGDSITDCGRSRENDSDFGRGYAMMAASWLCAKYPELNVNFINRGLSGDRVKDLRARWKRDCIDLKPDLVSIMIGINDTWRHYQCNDITSVENYRDDYRSLLMQIKESLNARVVLCEPFMLPVTEEQLRCWRDDLDPKIRVVRELAREFKTLHVPLDKIFMRAATKRETTFWLSDGVHPTQYGHALIAQAWLRTVAGI